MTRRLTAAKTLCDSVSLQQFLWFLVYRQILLWPVAVVAPVTSNSEDYYKAIIQGKDNEIELLKRQVAFMEKLLDKSSTNDRTKS